ncbi:hypothetical protein F0562_006936 [Nyssa sinensis]|uniref:NB-ARC domain-containing protein n=1 Tax=Nyssa sinensis TaxID=561372 RepID=A0A5J5A434_9ASTE|nr:hypothetical protein F0562_006936 [Nyssa sinensis]
MAADYLQFLKNKFIDDFKEALEEFDEFPLHPHFQKILEVLQARNISPATPLALKDPLYRLKFALAACSMFAEKERERKAHDKKDHFKVHSLKKLWFLYKTRKRLLKVEAKLCKTVDNEAVESSPLDLSLITSLKGYLPMSQSLGLQSMGMGGVGKTALANEVFWRVESQFDLKLWIRLSHKLNPEDVDSRIEIVRKILEHFEETTNHAFLDDLLCALYDNLRDRRWMVQAILVISPTACQRGVGVPS